MYEKEGIYYPFYSHVNMNNFVFSNTLASVLVINYENFTMDGKNYRFVEGNKDKDKSGELAAANEKWFMDNFYANGINFILNQTGFMDAYNWQPVSSATLIDAGDYTTLVAQASDSVMRTNSFFDDRRIIDSKDACWIHVAFISVGVTTGFTVEKTYAQVSLQDKRISYINTADMEVESTNPVYAIGEKALIKVSAGVWGYDNKQNIQPTTTYQVNDAFIERLHK